MVLDWGLGTTVLYGVYLGRVGEHRDRKKVLSVAIQVGYDDCRPSKEF